MPAPSSPASRPVPASGPAPASGRASPAAGAPRSLPLLAELIAFPTISADSNLALIDRAEALLQAAGFDVARIRDPDMPKAGLAARIGPAGPGGILLSAHSDVVPVAGQTWTRDPFTLTAEGGRLYGRGSTDMKGFLAAMLELAGRAGQARLAAPLMMVISYDEEVGCTGIRQMMPAIAALGWRPDLCLVGEPTAMRPARGHKGKAVWQAHCTGQPGHSAEAPRFVNALHLAADLIAALRDLQQHYAGDGAGTGTGDPEYAIPYSTVHAGVLEGGRVLNIVPDTARLTFELRHLPGDRPEDFRERLQQRIGALLRRYPEAAGIRIEPRNSYPGLDLPADHPALALAARLAAAPPGPKAGFGTEAGFFAAAGWPTVVCGPGDMAAQGHQPDEYLDAAQLLACERMLDRVLAHLLKI